MAIQGISDQQTFLRYQGLTGGRRVISGPFKGLRYIGSSSGSSYMPKILGTYEQELHKIWDAASIANLDAIIDIGCAEGYYLAGIGHLLSAKAQKLPELIGFDIDLEAIEKAKELLKLNALPAHNIYHGPFGIETLRSRRQLIICDIEGAEEFLLDSDASPVLRETWMLVEVHDNPGENRRLTILQTRFERTHHIEVIGRTPRTLNDFPQQWWPRVSKYVRLGWMDEHRLYGNTWLNMTPK
jgi:hypothetical protein